MYVAVLKSTSHDILTSCSLYQHIDTCTHISNNILDLIITRECDINFISSFELLHSTISEYACILCKCELPPPEVEKIYITGRKLLNIKVDNLCNDIKEACKEINYAGHDVDVEILPSHMGNTLKNLLDKHAPLISREIRKHPKCSWYKDEFRKEKRMKRRAERKYLKSHLTIHFDILKQQTRYYNELLKSAKSDYYKTKIDECDTKNPFKTVNSFFSISKNTKKTILPIHESKLELVNRFVEHLNKTVIDIRDNLRLNNKNCQSLLCRLSETCQTTIKNFENVSTREMMKIVSSTSNNTCHLDPLPVLILKSCLNPLILTLSLIINKSLATGVFPSIWKKSLVFPTLKRAYLDSENFCNYRPTSNIVFPLKLSSVWLSLN